MSRKDTCTARKVRTRTCARVGGAAMGCRYAPAWRRSPCWVCCVINSSTSVVRWREKVGKLRQNLITSISCKTEITVRVSSRAESLLQMAPDPRRKKVGGPWMHKFPTRCMHTKVYTNKIGARMASCMDLWCKLVHERYVSWNTVCYMISGYNPS